MVPFAQFVENWQNQIKGKALTALVEVYGEPIAGAPVAPTEQMDVEPHVLAMRRLSVPLTAQKYQELLDLRKQLTLEEDYDEYVG
jgi:hypothetical protein